jgi:DNA-binding response OmpR family regulator
VGKKILVIEDETEFRATFKEVLQNEGFEVEGSPYLATSVGWGLNGDFDLITLDLRMPEVDWLEVTRLYAKLIPDTSLLVISGYLDRTTVEELGTLGVKHTIAKPAGISDLLKAVDAALGIATNGHAPVHSSTNGHAQSTKR